MVGEFHLDLNEDLIIIRFNLDYHLKQTNLNYVDQYNHFPFFLSQNLASGLSLK